MDVVALVALVMTVTEVIKNLPFFSKLSPVIWSIIVSAGVVAYKALETQHPFDVALLGIFITVVITANGGHKLIKAANGGTR